MPRPMQTISQRAVQVIPRRGSICSAAKPFISMIHVLFVNHVTVQFFLCRPYICIYIYIYMYVFKDIYLFIYVFIHLFTFILIFMYFSRVR